MHATQLPHSEAKRRLLDAAEQLFAERGFEGVSVRDVTQLAATNVAAINYHFGTRDGLVALVVAGYLALVNDERLARLDAMEGKGPGKALPVEAILEAWIRPLVGTARKSGLAERLGCRLLGRIMALQGAGLPAAMEEALQRIGERFARAYGKALPTVTADELAWRLHFMAGALSHLLIHQDLPQRVPHGAAPAPTLDATLGRFIRFAAAGLREGVALDPGERKGPQATFDF